MLLGKQIEKTTKITQLQVHIVPTKVTQKKTLKINPQKGTKLTNYE